MVPGALGSGTPAPRLAGQGFKERQCKHSKKNYRNANKIYTILKINIEVRDWRGFRYENIFYVKVKFLQSYRWRTFFQLVPRCPIQDTSFALWPYFGLVSGAYYKATSTISPSAPR